LRGIWFEEERRGIQRNDEYSTESRYYHWSIIGMFIARVSIFCFLDVGAVMLGYFFI
jgi:hypothetical protein